MPRDALLDIPGVREVSVVAIGTGEQLSIECRTDVKDGVEADIARVVAAKWSLHRLQRELPTLENIFLRYVEGGQA